MVSDTSLFRFVHFVKFCRDECTCVLVLQSLDLREGFGGVGWDMDPTDIKLLMTGKEGIIS